MRSTVRSSLEIPSTKPIDPTRRHLYKSDGQHQDHSSGEALQQSLLHEVSMKLLDSGRAQPKENSSHTTCATAAPLRKEVHVSKAQPLLVVWCLALLSTQDCTM